MVRFMTHVKKEIREERLKELREAKTKKRVARRQMKERKDARKDDAR